jgi:uncharacterized protein YggE
MEVQMKRRLWWGLLVVGLLLLAGCQRATAQEQSQSELASRTIQLSGAGRVDAAPDVAVLRLGVQTEAEQASGALTQNSQQMQAVIDALKEGGVETQDIQTQFISLQPRYQEPRTANEARKLIGYTANNSIEVRVRALEDVGGLLDAAVQAGANQIQDIRFEVSEPAQLLEQARERAWEDAQAKAEQFADLAGVTLGDVLSINESSQGPGPVVREAVTAAQAVPIQPGSEAVTVNIEVTWLLR